MTPFGVFWLAQALSRFGDPITLIALAAVTYRTTSSALLTALAVVVATLPTAVFGFVGGAIADAVGPKRAMIACDLARAVLIGSIPLVLSTAEGLGAVYVLVIAAGFCGAVFNPARIAVIPDLVPPERLGEATARIGATDRTVEILGALSAGALVPLLAERAFYADALSFLASGVLLSALRTPSLARGRLSIQRLISDTGGGIRFLFSSSVLRANTVFSLAAQLALPVVNGLTPVLLIRRYAAGDAELGAALFGTSEAAIAAGAIMAGVALPEYAERVGKGRLVVGGFAVYGSLLILLGLAPSFLPALVIFFCMGAANIVFLVPNITISLEVTPPELRARVAGARIALLNLSWLPLVALSGAAADRVDVGPLISLAGGITVAVAIIGASWPTVRDVR